MKKLLFTLFIAFATTAYAQDPSIEFTSTLTEAEIGSTISVDFKYTISSDGYIYCAIELLDDFDYQSTVADAELNPAPAGTNVSSSFDLSIPEGTTPASDLTGNLNYKIKIELKDANFDYLDGDFPVTQINLTENLSNDEFQNENAFSISPNPTTNFIEINGLNTAGISNFTIFNTLGKKVFSSENVSSNKVDVSQLNTGIYFISIAYEGKVQTLKFIKK